MKRECDTKNVQNGGKERKGSKGRRALRATRAKRYPERGQDRETIAVTTKSNRCHIRIQGNRKVALKKEKNDVSNGFLVRAGSYKKLIILIDY